MFMDTGIVFAQENTPDASGQQGTTSEVPEENSGEATEIPTVTATEVPTDVPTSVPTAAPTEAATQEPTDTSEVEPTATAPSEGSLAALGSLIPTLDEPGNKDGNADAIFDRTPTFKWSEVEGATDYNLFVYQIESDGIIKIYSKTYKSYSICDDSVCEATPGTNLGYGNFQWKVRADVDSKWQDFSDYSYFTIIDTIPDTQSPDTTIYENTPTFVWSEIPTVSRYEIVVMNSRGSTLHTQITEDFTCDPKSDECSVVSDTALDIGVYRWKIRAYYNNKWRDYSGRQGFSIAGDFNEDFTNDTGDWKTLYGASWRLGSGNYYTDGKAQKLNSARNAYIYTDLDMTGNVKRDGGIAEGAFPANYLCVRMSSHRNSQYLWYTGYMFGYTNAGNYSIIRMDSGGTATILQPWTSTSAVKKNDWNELHVIANGSDFSFYINGTLVNNFTDESYTRGYVGVEMYRPDSGKSRFYMDSAALTILNTDSTSLSAESVSPQQRN
jgi:hypothetical protein